MNATTTDIRRITPEEVLAAYARHPKIRPIRKFTVRDGGCCAIGILAVDAGCPTHISGAIECLGLDRGYAEGFASGFNGCEYRRQHCEDVVGNCDTAELGLADGKAVAAAVFKGEGP